MRWDWKSEDHGAGRRGRGGHIPSEVMEVVVEAGEDAEGGRGRGSYCGG